MTTFALPVDRIGAYLTDELFLYRVVAVVAGEPDDVVELEDCYLLDVVGVPAGDLRARGLRVVTPVSRESCSGG